MIELVSVAPLDLVVLFFSFGLIDSIVLVWYVGEG